MPRLRNTTVYRKTTIKPCENPYDESEKKAKDMTDQELLDRIAAIVDDDNAQCARGFRGRISCGDPEFSALSHTARTRGVRNGTA